MVGMIVVVILLWFGRVHEHGTENRDRFDTAASDLRSNLDVKSDASVQRGRAQMPLANH
jgi:hypothetical protein